MNTDKEFKGILEYISLKTPFIFNIHNACVFMAEQLGEKNNEIILIGYEAATKQQLLLLF